MNLGTVFKLSLYALTALVGAILGAAEGEGTTSGSTRTEFVLPFLSLPIVIFGYLLTERKWTNSMTTGGGLSAGWANSLGILALIATGYEFFSESREGKLLAGTHLLLYATWIVLIQRKTIRLYWFLMALGILQLAVASVLTTKGWFGFCAILYMFGAVWTLSIFSLWRAEQLFVEEEATDERSASRLPAGAAVPPRETRQPSSQVHSSVQHEDGTNWLTVRFVSGVLMTSCSALIVSTAFFLFVPRLWVGAEVSIQNAADGVANHRSVTGLATSVRLGELGETLESLEPVFEIRLTNMKSNQPMSAIEYADRLGMAEPLFRGAVLTSYLRGRWSADLPAHASLHNRPFERPMGQIDVLQEIRLLSTAHDILFCLGHPIAMADSRRTPFGEINEISGISTFTERRNEGGALEYNVYSMLPKQHPLHHKLRVSPVIREVYRRIGYLDLARKIPNNLRQLTQLTKEVIQAEVTRRQKMEGRSTPRELTDLETASALESYLRDSGAFTYSLSLAIDDPKIDPIEDFLFNRKSGHCEYFATALALMMRAAKIPARAVSGYKGGVPRSGRTAALEVQQRFAHMWVEAWVEGDGWTTFDATPEDARTRSIDELTAKTGSLWAGMQTTLSGLWSENVLNMTLDRQERSIYKPMRELAYSLGVFMQQLMTSPTEALRTLWDILTNREQWFSVGGGIFAFVFLMSVAAGVWLVRFGMTRLRAWLQRMMDARHRSNRRVIEFYERFLRLMNSRGLQRGPTQTPQEFAEQVTSAFSPELSASDLPNGPTQISQLFYRVRFGEESLSDEETQRMEQLLTRLEQLLAPRAGTGNARA